MFSRSVLISTILVAGVTVAFAQESTSKTLQQVQEQLEARRKLREDAQGNRGIVFTPIANPDGWFKEPRELKLDGVSLISCGETFATLARKEVMISGRVAKKMITVSTGSVSSDEAFKAFCRAIEGQKIGIIPVGDRILVLVDSADAPK